MIWGTCALVWGRVGTLGVGGTFGDGASSIGADGGETVEVTGDETMTAICHLDTIFSEASPSVSPPVTSTVSPPSAPMELAPSPKVPPIVDVE